MVSVLLVFVIGVAIQRGNTCTVVAIDDIVRRRSWDRFLAIAYSWLWVAGGLTVLALTTGFHPSAAVFPVTVWSVVAGALLGFGAVVNGACTTGTIARIGSGQHAFAFTLVGFFLGCLLAPHVLQRATITHTATAPTTTSLDHPAITLFGLAAVAALTARRLLAGGHETFRQFLRSAWDPRTATFIIAILFVTLVQIDGPWAYTELIGDIAKGSTGGVLNRSIFFTALLAGAIVAGRSLTGTQLTGPLAPRVVRCTVGGLFMGMGYSAAPGAFDGLTLLGQPLLLPFAWVVMAASYLSITAGLLYLRSSLAPRILAIGNPASHTTPPPISGTRRPPR